MKKQIALILATFAITGSVFAQSSVSTQKRMPSFYIEPAAVYVPSNNGSDDAFGASISSGVRLRERHLVGLDLAFFEADYDTGPGKMKFMPLTASYQYVYPVWKNIQLRGGVLAGAMFEKSKDRPGISSSNRTAFTYGASVGVDFGITEYASVGVSGKWMHVDDVKDLRERDMALLGLNLMFRF